MMFDPQTLDANQAQRVIEKLYAGRFDRLGYPEIDHVRRVVMLVPGRSRTVAWMHDTLEDGILSHVAAFRMINQVQYEALLAVTRDVDVMYMDYIRRIRDWPGDAGFIAREIKRADLRDNMTRACPPEMLSMRAPGGRYQRAAQILGMSL